MKKQRFLVLVFFLFRIINTFSQGFLLTPPKLIFDGTQLQIYYDIITRNPEDKFYTWLEIKRSNGDFVIPKNLSGDVGDNIKPGSNKKITWLPRQDSVYIDEEIFVEIKAEKYVKSFNRGTVILQSIVFPGWGQTRISKGKPWWITGVVFYGTMAGGYVCYKNYLDTYDSYKVEADESIRNDLLQKSQQQLNYASALVFSGAAIWAINVFWVAVTPNRYHLLHNVNLVMGPSAGTTSGSYLLSFRLNF